MIEPEYHYTAETPAFQTIKDVFCQINVSLDQLEDLFANIHPLPVDQHNDIINRLVFLHDKMEALPLPPQ